MSRRHVFLMWLAGYRLLCVHVICLNGAVVGSRSEHTICRRDVVRATFCTMVSTLPARDFEELLALLLALESRSFNKIKRLL